jgi:hypothetical protein
MSRSRIEQQLDLHGTCTDLDKIEDAKQGGTRVFEDEAEAGDCQFDEDPTCAVLWDHAVKKTWGTFYKDTWRIEPDQLKCRRKADGQLWKLGQGKFASGMQRKSLQTEDCYSTLNCCLAKWCASQALKRCAAGLYSMVAYLSVAQVLVFDDLHL